MSVKKYYLLMLEHGKYRLNLVCYDAPLINDSSINGMGKLRLSFFHNVRKSKLLWKGEEVTQNQYKGVDIGTYSADP